MAVRQITDMRNGGVQSGGLSTSRDLVAMHPIHLIVIHAPVQVAMDGKVQLSTE